jgi:hypothetical protein
MARCFIGGCAAGSFTLTWILFWFERELALYGLPVWLWLSLAISTISLAVLAIAALRSGP